MAFELPPNPASPKQRTDLSVIRVRDVIVCAAEATDSTTDEDWRDHPPVGFNDDAEAVDLGESISLLTLPFDEAETIMDACEPRGRNYSPTRQFGQRYSFVRERPVAVDQGAGHSTFDEGSHMQHALALSRLVRDNGFSLQYAARVSDRGDGEQIIRPIAFFEGIAAYRLRRGREWLDVSEAEDLAALLERYRGGGLPSRVGEALWRADHSTWQRWAKVALPELVGGLEALTKIGRGQLTAQFKNRIPALAEDVGVDGVDKDSCQRIYDARSDWVHGSQALFGREGDDPPADAEHRELLNDMAMVQDVLRQTCRRAIEDPNFRAVFADDAAIEERWPA